MGAVGVASGSLQMASAAHPKDRNLAGVNLGFGIANGIAAIVMGAATAEVGFAGITESLSTIDTVTNSFVVSSGVSNTLAGVTGEASSGIGAKIMANPGLTKQSGWSSAENVLGAFSMLFMVASIASDVGAFISGNISVYRSYRDMDDESGDQQNRIDVEQLKRDMRNCGEDPRLMAMYQHLIDQAEGRVPPDWENQPIPTGRRDGESVKGYLKRRARMHIRRSRFFKWNIPLIEVRPFFGLRNYLLKETFNTPSDAR